MRKAYFDLRAHLFQVRVTQQGQNLHQGLGRQIPPAELQQQVGQFLIKALFDKLGRIAAKTV